jgi:DNA polymerase IV
MIADQGLSSKGETVHKSIFSSQPPIFILPTHLSLETLDQAESQLLDNGGNLTYDIAEAGLIIGKVNRPKRAALELRSRGIWTEDIATGLSSTLTTAGTAQPPAKRRRTDIRSGIRDVPVEVIDLSTESESEEDGARTRHDPSKHLVKIAPPPDNTVTVLKLEWLESSIAAGECLRQDSYLVYRGRKIPSPTTTRDEKKDFDQISNQIIQRAKQDATHPAPNSSEHINPRRSKEPEATQRRPKLYRQTTSEHDANDTPPQPDWVRNNVLLACMRSAPLHPPNEDFISQLIKIRRIRELTLDEIGVRAYSTSIASLASYPYLLRRPSEVLVLPGCEAKIADLFTQYQERGGCEHTNDDGTVAAAHALDSDPVLRVLNLFYQIWGVGAKTAREFYYHRGWRDLDDIVEHGWNNLSRVQQIGVKYFDEFAEGISRRESEDIANTIREHANRVRPGAGAIECVIVGGYRRGKESCGDVDVILTHRDDSVTKNLVVDVVASLEKESYITHTLSLHLTSSLREQQTLPFHAGDRGRGFDTLDKAMVVWQDPRFDSGNTLGNKNPNIHRRVDIIISPWRTVGCAVLGWSGDTTFQRDLRRHAKKTRSWKFDSSGVRDRSSGGQVLDLESGGETWEERERLVMEHLGIGWRPPNERCSR